jgi:hypothetical protein
MRTTLACTFSNGFSARIFFKCINLLSTSDLQPFVLQEPENQEKDSKAAPTQDNNPLDALAGSLAVSISISNCAKLIIFFAALLLYCTSCG